MGGDDGGCPLHLEVFRHRLGQGRPFHGVRAGAQFVQQYQVLFPHRGQERNELGNVAGEGGQVILDALFITDDGVNMVVHRKAGALSRRNEEARLVHEGKKARRLDGDGLAAGVGAGNDENIECLPQCHGYRHHLIRRNQGMPCFPEVQYLSPGPQCLHRLHGQGQFCPGEDEFQFRGQVAVIPRHFHGLLHFFREVPEDFLDFLLLRRRHFGQVVIQLHGHHGFHEQGLPRGGPVMDNAGELVPVLFLHRHHVPAVPLGNDGILQVGRHVLVLEDVLERAADAGLHGLLLGPDTGQLQGGAVLHFPMVVKDPVNPVNQAVLGHDEGGQFFQGGVQEMLLPFEIVVHLFIGVQGIRQVQEFLRRKDAVLFRLFQEGPDIVGLSQGRGDFLFQEHRSFVRFFQALFHHLRHIGRDEMKGPLFGQGGRRQVRQFFPNLIKFQYFQYIFFHYMTPLKKWPLLTSFSSSGAGAFLLPSSMSIVSRTRGSIFLSSLRRSMTSPVRPLFTRRSR